MSALGREQSITSGPKPDVPDYALGGEYWTPDYLTLDDRRCQSPQPNRPRFQTAETLTIIQNQLEGTLSAKTGEMPELSKAQAMAARAMTLAQSFSESRRSSLIPTT